MFSLLIPVGKCVRSAGSAAISCYETGSWGSKTAKLAVKFLVSREFARRRVRSLIRWQADATFWLRLTGDLSAMTRRAARLVYFERWLDPVAETILSSPPEIELMRLSYGDPVAETDARIRPAHGYQISPRTELLGPWFGDRNLLAKCSNLLAISSSGAGYERLLVR